MVLSYKSIAYPVLKLKLDYCLQANSIMFLVILIVSLVMGIVLNYTMFLCTIVNSALTTTIVGVLKGVGSTVRLPCILTHTVPPSFLFSLLLIFVLLIL